jgi:hypothetical protein
MVPNEKILPSRSGKLEQQILMLIASSRQLSEGDITLNRRKKEDINGVYRPDSNA